MSVEVRRANWHLDEARIKAIRHQVFVLEQRVDPEIEWDGQDSRCQHVLAVCDGDYVATGRLQGDGRIGRMAVLPPWRGRGVGGAVLAKLIEIATKSGMADVSLHAQVHAVSFYEHYGFQCEGGVFDEAGIAHRHMLRPL